jgi:Arc/MetJ-type ribon-helix-helix transcriptional regulator
MFSNMKTIAVSIDERTIELLDALVGMPGEGFDRRSRSAVVRAAVREFAERESRCRIEARESDILKRNRKRLGRQARALITEQARP